MLAFPFVYLGIPIGANPRRCQMWDPIIHKCERKLAKWKQRHISFGGRVTLIQSVLTSIPIYFFSFFRVLQLVVDKLVKLQRRFLWQEDLTKTRLHGLGDRQCIYQKKRRVWASRTSTLLILLFSTNGSGIFYSTKGNYGLEYWSPNMVDGGIWMKQVG